MSDSRLAIRASRTGTTARITATGDLDIATASRLLTAIDRVFEGPTEIVLVDVIAVTLIDSSGLYALLDAVGDYPDEVRIVPGPAWFRLISILDLDDKLPLVREADRLMSAEVAPSQQGSPGTASASLT